MRVPRSLDPETVNREAVFRIFILPPKRAIGALSHSVRLTALITY